MQQHRQSWELTTPPRALPPAGASSSRHPRALQKQRVQIVISATCVRLPPHNFEQFQGARQVVGQSGHLAVHWALSVSGSGPRKWAEEMGRWKQRKNAFLSDLPGSHRRQ